MTDFLYLIPVALAMGAIGLGAFLWSLGSGQYEDLDGAAERILLDEDDVPAPDKQSIIQTSPEPPRTPPYSRPSADGAAGRSRSTGAA